MRPIVSDRVAWSGRRSVGLSLTVVSPAKTAEPIEMPFGIWTRVGVRKHVLGADAHWRHLANTNEPSMCRSDAACCQITLTTCLHSSPFFSTPNDMLYNAFQSVIVSLPIGAPTPHVIRIPGTHQTQRSVPSCTSIGSAVFAQLTADSPVLNSVR